MARRSRPETIRDVCTDHNEQRARYQPGQFYKVHHDQNSGLFTPQGVRVYTFFMYLSTPQADALEESPRPPARRNPSRRENLLF